MAVGAAAGLAVLAGAGLAVAEGSLTITPASGPPGTSYAVQVTCGEAPQVKRANTQDGPLQGTVPDYPADQVLEVQPSVWEVEAEATETDDAWSAVCGGELTGSGRFDAESPHLWFGPRPRPFPGPDYQYTTVEGSDCPAGSTPEVSIAVEGFDVLFFAEPEVDQYGDWSTPLPWPVGERAMTVQARCGDVTYEELQATTTSTSTTSSTTSTSSTTTTTAPPPATNPAPATPVRGTAGYTG